MREFVLLGKRTVTVKDGNGKEHEIKMLSTADRASLMAVIDQQESILKTSREAGAQTSFADGEKASQAVAKVIMPYIPDELRESVEAMIYSDMVDFALYLARGIEPAQDDDTKKN